MVAGPATCRRPPGRTVRCLSRRIAQQRAAGERWGPLALASVGNSVSPTRPLPGVLGRENADGVRQSATRKSSG